MKILFKLMQIKDIYKKIFFIAVFFVSLLLMFYSVNFYEFFNNEIIYLGNINQKIDYNVKIFPNNIFKEEVLRSGDTYISKLVDDINVSYSYNHTSSIEGELELFYTSKATTLIMESSERNNESAPVIKENKHVLKDRQKIESASSISDNIAVDYNVYVSEIKEFQEAIYQASYSWLILSFEVEAVKHLENQKNISATTTGRLKIPLTGDSFIITPDFESSQEKKYMKYDNPAFYVNYVLLVISSAALILDILLFYLNKKMSYIYSLKSPGEIDLERFMAEYRDMVIETTQIPDFTDKNKIFLNSFSELSNLSYLTQNPVVYFKDISSREVTKNYFFVTREDIVYIFIFKT